MKKLLIFLTFILITLSSFSQKLKKEKEGISGKTMWTTSKEEIFKKGAMSSKVSEKLEFNFIKIDSFILFNIYCISPDKNAGFINKGQELQMNMGGEKVLTLYAANTFASTGGFKNIGGMFFSFEASYLIDKKDYELLAKNFPTYMRVHTQSDIYDFAIKNNNGDVITKAFNLIVNK